VSGYDVIIVGFRLNAQESPARALERVLGLPSEQAKRVAKHFPYTAASDVSAEDAEALRARLFEAGARSTVRSHDFPEQGAAHPGFDPTPPPANDSVVLSYGIGDLVIETNAQQAVPNPGESAPPTQLTAEPRLRTKLESGGRFLDDSFETTGAAHVELDLSSSSPSLVEGACPAVSDAPRVPSKRRVLGGAPRRMHSDDKTRPGNRWGLLVALPLLAFGLSRGDSLFLGQVSPLTVCLDLCGLYAAFTGLLGYPIFSLSVLSIVLSLLTATTTWFAMPYVLAETARAPVVKVEAPLGTLHLEEESVACSFHVFRAPQNRLGLSSNAIVLRTEEGGSIFVTLEGRFSDRSIGWKELSADPKPLVQRIIVLDWILNKGVDASQIQRTDERPAGIARVSMSIERARKVDEGAKTPIYDVEAYFVVALSNHLTRELRYVGPMAIVDEQ
jgi:hypothetical protein